MDSSIKLIRIWGIPIGVHFSWFLIFILTTWSLAAGYFPRAYPRFSDMTHWGLALVTSLLFFGSVLAHELGHSYIAIRNKIPVKSVTLFIFGGVAQISQEPQTPGDEFRIAIAGPITSLVLALFFGGFWLLSRPIPVVAATSIYLARINLLLALFNMIPGFPLDGGRVLRAVIWWFTKNFHRSTRTATIAGQVVAFGFLGLGGFSILIGNFMNGLWLVFIGWFLQNAAATSFAQNNLLHALQGIRVSQVMSTDCVQVQPLVTLNQLVTDHVLNGGKNCFFVDDGTKLLGMITLRDITAIPQQKWRFITTSQAMVPYSRLEKVAPDAELLTVLQVMDNAKVAQLPVVDGVELVGVISREQVMHYLRTRAELRI